MATEDILIRYRADVSQLEADINKIIDSQEELTKATNQNTQAQQKAVNSAEFAAKKRAQLLEQEVQKLEKLKKAQLLAFDPVQIEKYNRQIQESQRRIDVLEGKYQDAANTINISNQQILGGINRIANAFGIAFSVEAVISFAKEAVNAFAQAEKSVSDLRNTIVLVSGEGEQAFESLNTQAENLGKTTIFSSEQIRSAQSILSNFGLLSGQIEDLIPKLAGFAKATNQDIVSAAQKVGSALNGSAKEFNNLGANISSTNTALENYNEVLRVSSQFTDQAALDLTKVNDQLLQQQKLSSDLSTFVGSKLASAWQAVTLAVNGATAALLGYDIKRKQYEGQAVSDAQKTTEAFIERAKKIGLSEDELLKKLESRTAGLKFQLEQAEKNANREITNEEEINSIKLRRAQTEKRTAELESVRIKALLDAAQTEVNAIRETNRLKEETLTIDQIRAKTTDELNKYVKDNQNVNRIGIQSNITLINREIEARKKANETAAADAQKALEQFKNLINSIDAEIAKLQNDLERRKIEVIPEDSQKAQEDRIKALADLNEKSINDEIAGKIKLVKDDAKLSEQQKQDLIKKYEELKQARLNLAQFNEQNELNIISAQQVKRIEDAFKQIDDLNIEQALVIEADKVEAANEAVAKSFEDLAEAITLEDFALAKDAATARTKALNQALIEENNINKTRIENARDAENAKVQAGDAAEAERKAIKIKYDNQIANADKELQNKLDKNNEDLTDNIDEQEKALLKTREDRLFQYADATAAVLSELTNLYSQFSENRIKSIEDDLEKEIEAIDLLEERNQEAFEQGIISQAELKIAQDQARQQRVNAELAAEKKIKEEKKKAAQLEKANALVQIAIDTARNIVQQPGVLGALIPFWAILGAAQAAAVLAQPIPYAVGSKDTGEREHMARVGEHGEEFIWMPSNSKVLPARQTKKYSDVIDAMYDNRLDDFIYKNYVTPALMNQKQKSEAEGQRSFADNLAKSIYFNGGLNATDMEQIRRKGQRINNVDEIAQAIARQLPKYDPYRN